MCSQKTAIHRPITTIVFLASIMVLGVLATMRMKWPIFQRGFPLKSRSLSRTRTPARRRSKKTSSSRSRKRWPRCSGIKNMNFHSHGGRRADQPEFDWGKKLDLVRTKWIRRWIR